MLSLVYSLCNPKTDDNFIIRNNTKINIKNQLIFNFTKSNHLYLISFIIPIESKTLFEKFIELNNLKFSLQKNNRQIRANYEIFSNGEDALSNSINLYNQMIYFGILIIDMIINIETKYANSICNEVQYICKDFGVINKLQKICNVLLNDDYPTFSIYFEREMNDFFDNTKLNVYEKYEYTTLFKYNLSVV
jgi:hypothetical protein